MFVPSTSETRTKLPELFTAKARREVFSKMGNVGDGVEPEEGARKSRLLPAFLRGGNVAEGESQATTPLTTLNTRSTTSLTTLTTTQNVMTNTTNLMTVTQNVMTSSRLESGRQSRRQSTTQSTTHSPTQSTTHDSTTLPSLPTTLPSLATTTRTPYSSLLPSYHHLVSPIVRTFTNLSLESSSSRGSIFSSNSLRSVSTNASVVSHDSDHVLPAISKFLKSDKVASVRRGEPLAVAQASAAPLTGPHSQPHAGPPSQPHKTPKIDPRTTISLEKAISDIKDLSSLHPHRNIGYQVFTQLNDAILLILKSQNLQLIDWNLNLIRCSLMVDELPQAWAGHVPLITVNGNSRYKIQDGFQSELVKLISSYRRQQKNYLPTSDLNFRKFIRSVMQNRFLVVGKRPSDGIKFNKNINEDVIRVQVVPQPLTEASLVEFLTHCDLFKEFNLETEFRRRVATISIKQGQLLGGRQGSGEVPYTVLALRNFFLNLLVASQTLFEFHYTINELLDKQLSGQESSDQELKWLWDNIRERNFSKIEVFDKYY